MYFALSMLLAGGALATGVAVILAGALNWGWGAAVGSMTIVSVLFAWLGWPRRKGLR